AADVRADQSIDLAKHIFEVADCISGCTVDPDASCAAMFICRRLHAQERRVLLDGQGHGTAQRFRFRRGDTVALPIDLRQEVSRKFERIAGGSAALASTPPRLTSLEYSSPAGNRDAT